MRILHRKRPQNYARTARTIEVTTSDVEHKKKTTQKAILPHKQLARNTLAPVRLTLGVSEAKQWNCCVGMIYRQGLAAKAVDVCWVLNNLLVC